VDTRTKIIDYEEAVRITSARPARWVVGHFDPLLVEHARKLHAYSEPGFILIVVVTNPKSGEALLPQRARAELVAALRDVNYVVLKDGPMDDPEDQQITQTFIEHVAERNNGAAF
jgi:hypothetical protein